MRAYPWGRLSMHKRAEIEAASRVRAFVAQGIDLSRVSRALEEITGARVSATLRSAGASDMRVLDPGAIGILFADDSSRTILIEIEAALAVALVGSALKRPRTRIVDAQKANTPAIAGAAAAVLTLCARRVSNGIPPRVLSCGSAAALWAEAHRQHPNRLAATFLVMVGDDAFVARASIPTETVVAPNAPFSIASLGNTPLELPIVACTTSALPSELRSLASGDVLVPGDLRLSGDVALCAPFAETGVRARLGDDLVLGDEPVSLPWQPEGSMSKDALEGSLAEVPVIVRVEIGTARMSARDWAKLGAGDVVTLGKKIGEHVVLRVGGEEVARGELVDVEGEVGVRIVKLER